MPLAPGPVVGNDVGGTTVSAVVQCDGCDAFLRDNEGVPNFLTARVARFAALILDWEIVSQEGAPTEFLCLQCQSSI